MSLLSQICDNFEVPQNTNKCFGWMKKSEVNEIVKSVFPKSHALCMCILTKSEWLYNERKLWYLLKHIRCLLEYVSSRYVTLSLTGKSNKVSVGQWEYIVILMVSEMVVVWSECWYRITGHNVHKKFVEVGWITKFTL